MSRAPTPVLRPCPPSESAVARSKSQADRDQAARAPPWLPKAATAPPHRPSLAPTAPRHGSRRPPPPSAGAPPRRSPSAPTKPGNQAKETHRPSSACARPDMAAGSPEFGETAAGRCLEDPIAKLTFFLGAMLQSKGSSVTLVYFKGPACKFDLK
jgi:hypothetical protein